MLTYITLDIIRFLNSISKNSRAKKIIYLSLKLYFNKEIYDKIIVNNKVRNLYEKNTNRKTNRSIIFYGK